jgi:hypothetical protein
MNTIYGVKKSPYFHRLNFAYVYEDYDGATSKVITTVAVSLRFLMKYFSPALTIICFSNAFCLIFSRNSHNLAFVYMRISVPSQKLFCGDWLANETVVGLLQFI